MVELRKAFIMRSINSFEEGIKGLLIQPPLKGGRINLNGNRSGRYHLYPGTVAIKLTLLWIDIKWSPSGNCVFIIHGFSALPPESGLQICNWLRSPDWCPMYIRKNNWATQWIPVSFTIGPQHQLERIWRLQWNDLPDWHRTHPNFSTPICSKNFFDPTKHWYKWMHNHTGCICYSFLHCTLRLSIALRISRISKT